MYSFENLPYHHGCMYPSNFFNPAGPQPLYGPFMPPVIPPTGQQGYQSMPYPHQGKFYYPSQLCQPQAPQST